MWSAVRGTYRTFSGGAKSFSTVIAGRDQRLPNAAFIAAGNMADPMVQAALKIPGMAPDKVCVAARSKAHLFGSYGVAMRPSVAAAVQSSQLLFLCPKPQIFAEVMAGAKVTDDSTCVSIMAGVPMAVVERVTGCTQVIRCMPNTPGAVGLGITGFCAADGVDPVDLSLTKQVLSGMGKVVEFKTERDLDKVTAISGSGPAYIFSILQDIAQLLQMTGSSEQGLVQSILAGCAFGMIQAGQELGLETSVVLQLVGQTFVGAAAYARHCARLAEPVDMPTLIKQVRSPGGTTNAALLLFDEEALSAQIAVPFGVPVGALNQCSNQIQINNIVWQLAEQTGRHVLSGKGFQPFGTISGTIERGVYAAHQRAGELGQIALVNAGLANSVISQDALAVKHTLEGLVTQEPAKHADAVPFNK